MMRSPLVGSCLTILLAAVCAIAAHSEEPRKGRIAYSRRDGERVTIHVMNADGTGDVELPGQTAKVNVFPTWSSDGKKIGYMTMDPGEPFGAVLSSLDGATITKVAGPAPKSGLPAFHPDGSQLAFVSGGGTPAVFVGDAFGANARQVNPAGTGALYPFWSTDGKKVGYTHLAEGDKGEIALGTPDGGDTQVITSCGALAIAGPNALSPDGKRLAYFSLDRATKNGSLRILDLATKAETTVTELTLENLENFQNSALPAWSPNGKALVVAIPKDKKRELHLVSEDGKSVRLSPEGADCLSGAWTAK